MFWWQMALHYPSPLPSHRPLAAAIAQTPRRLDFFFFHARFIEKGNVFYGLEPPSGESTTTECVVNYQLLAVIY